MIVAVVGAANVSRTAKESRQSDNEFAAIREHFPKHFCCSCFTCFVLPIRKPLYLDGTGFKSDLQIATNVPGTNKSERLARKEVAL
jgi:hypothetical protein